MAARKAKSKPPESFVEARERLDAILEELEQEAGDVDRLATRIREAAELLRFCRERLAGARQEVQQVVAELDADENAPAATSADGAPPPDDDEADADAPADDDASAPGKRRSRAADGGPPPDGLPF